MEMNEGSATVKVKKAEKIDMRIFSFRAECENDVERFKEACTKVNTPVFIIQWDADVDFPDVEIELASASGLSELRNVMRSVTDGHVMLQTLRECKLSENSLERDYDLE